MGFVFAGSPDDHHEVIVNKYVKVQGSGDDADSIIARNVATEGTVLLKNENNILPLSKDGWDKGDIFKVGIFGEDSGEGKGPNFCEDRGMFVL